MNYYRVVERSGDMIILSPDDLDRPSETVAMECIHSMPTYSARYLVYSIDDDGAKHTEQCVWFGEMDGKIHLCRRP